MIEFSFSFFDVTLQDFPLEPSGLAIPSSSRASRWFWLDRHQTTRLTIHFMLTCIRARTHGECVIRDRIPSVSSHYWFMRRGFPWTRSQRREESPAERLIIFLPLYTPRQHLRANIWLSISFYISRGFVGRNGGAAAVAGELWGKLSRNIQTSPVEVPLHANGRLCSSTVDASAEVVSRAVLHPNLQTS